MADRHAVIDLGSNSFRLVVFEAHPEGWWRRSDEVHEAVRIGEGLQESGLLGARGMARGRAVLDVFAAFCRSAGIGPEAIDAVATSAIRDARNGGTFVESAQVAGLPARVLSTEQEARYGYLAAINSTALDDGVVLDLGGGSLQLTRVRDRGASAFASWPLGAVRMTERFLARDAPAKRKHLEALREHVLEELAAAEWVGGHGGRLVALGGTARTLAAAAQRATGLPEFGVQGFSLTREHLEDLVVQLAAVPPGERAKVPGIKPARAEIILAGAVVVQGVLEHGGFEAAEVTEAGLREGVWFERLLAPAERFDDVRRASVLNLAAQYGAHPARNRHVAHVVELALGLFDELAGAGLHPGDPAERELLWAAAVLHDIGMAIDYDDHHKHSRYLVLNAGLPGFSPREVALVGQAVRFHRKGDPSLGPFTALTRKGDEARLTRLSALLRLAEGLERPRDQGVRAAHAVAADGTVALQVDADDDARVPRWAVARETALFARAFGRELVV